MNLGSFSNTKSFLIFAISINNKHFIMNKSIKKLVFPILFLVTMVNLHAQSNMDYRFYAGITGAGVLDSGQGAFVAVNPTLNLSDNFKLESRVGFSAINVTSSFLQGKQGNAILGFLQAGPRYVFRSPEKRVRPALSILGGYAPVISKGGDATNGMESSISLSINFDFEINQFVIGLISDASGNNLVNGLKIGFKF